MVIRKVLIVLDSSLNMEIYYYQVQWMELYIYIIISPFIIFTIILISSYFYSSISYNNIICIG